MRTNPSLVQVEIAVIGSGPGGSVTAALLAEAGRNVLIIEEGHHLALESCESFSTAEMEQKYRNGGLTPALGKPKVAYVEGCCVGGGSEINSGLYHRIPEEVLNSWRSEFHLADSSLGEMLPYFQENEADLSVQTMPPPLPAASLKLQDGASALGWKSMEVPRWYSYDPPGGEFGAPKGKRVSMTRSFIPRALKAGATLMTDCRILRLRREGRKWALRGEQFIPGQNPKAVLIHAEVVFVCGGAIQTPALLRRSGITLHVGNNLQMHPTVKAVALFREKVNLPGAGVSVHQVKEFSPRISLGCSISSLPYLALALLDYSHGTADLARWQEMAIYYAMITPKARGTVRTLPGFRDPVVRFPLTEPDLRNLSDGLTKLTRCLFAAGAEAIYPSIADFSPLRRPGDLSTIPNILPRDRTNLMTIHLLSSCPMGENRDICATSSFGALNGQANLYVADGSLLCTAPGVNPQGGIMAFARRNARHFISETK